MTQAPDRTQRGEIVARETELEQLHAFVARTTATRALVVVGEPGIGKTALWEQGCELARRSGTRVLASRPHDAEIGLSFAALADLLESVDLALLDVPAPQRLALDAALLRAEPHGDVSQPFAISSGLLSALRALSTAEPLLVAVDDLPWLDRPSADALAYAARRLRGHDVRFLLARRAGEDSPFEGAMGREDVERLEVGPLSLGASRELLLERLGLSPPRGVLRQIHETGQGNPLFTLEIGRALLRRDPSEAGAELPVPQALGELFGDRIARCSPPVRRALLAVALNGTVTVEELASVVDRDTVEDALDAGLLALEGGKARPAHPLLAVSSRAAAGTRERRSVHAELAEAIGDPVLRARHLSLATESFSEKLSATVSAAAAVAQARGSAQDAAELAEHALRLTPPSASDYPVRLLDLARFLVIAGEIPRARELIGTRIDELPPGPARARAYLLLSETADGAEMESYLDSALAESSGDPGIRATALATKALLHSIGRMHRLDQAESWAREALEVAEDAGPEVERRALHALAWIFVLRGRSVDELLARFRSAPQEASLYESAIERPAGIRLMLQGRIEDARAVFGRLRDLAEERGEARSGSVMHVQLCDIALRAGEIQAAARYLQEWDEWSALEDDGGTRFARCSAQLAVLQGRHSEAISAARTAIAAGEKFENRREQLEAVRTLGIAALLGHEPAEAVEHLGAVWRHAQSEGIDDPGALPVAPDLVEALVETGRLEEGRAVTARLRELAEAQAHPWGLASASRCDALIRLADGDGTALDAIMEAADAYGALGLRFDRARSLLLRGRAARRLRKWAVSRDALAQAVAAFEELGAVGWAELARSEHSRVGGRPPSEGVLTPAEARVADLASAGLANKEIAAALYISVHTVERHLKRVYTKLGVRSRTQLAARLGSNTGS